MPSRKVAGIVFDMDGVLIDSGDVYAAHWREWCAGHGIDYERVAKVHPGRPPRSTIAVVAPELDAEEEARRFNETLDALAAADRVRAMPGASRALVDLPPGRWAVATSATREMAGLWLRAAGLPVPEHLVSADDVTHGKPSPEPYLKAAEALGSAAGDCLVIEDAPAGITAASAAGASVLALETTHARAELTEADAVTSSLELVRISERPDGLVVSWE